MSVYNFTKASFDGDRFYLKSMCRFLFCFLFVYLFVFGDRLKNIAVLFTVSISSS